MIEEIIASIRPLHNEAMTACQQRLDNLIKPLNSLQGFEQLAVKLAGISGDSRPRDFKAGLILMSADEGVDLTESDGIKKLAQEFSLGACPIQVMAEHIGADILLVDIGEAMSGNQAESAVRAGIEIVRKPALKGYAVLGIGGLRAEDSLASMAVVAAYSDKSKQADFKGNAVDISDPWDVLSKAGSLEIAGLVGVILGAAAEKKAIVLDGLLAAAAAIIATELAPISKAYLIGSHKLPGYVHEEALRILELPAYLELEMTLGQGCGAALGISLLRAALHMLNDMKTFTEAKVAVAEDGPGALKQNT